MLNVKLIGNRIREMRLGRGLTQNTFAEALHVSFQAVSNWERGIAPPDLENLVNIAAYFGVLVDDLLRTGAEDVFLGVDGGGTKTEFAVVNSAGEVLYSFEKSGCNPNDVGFDAAAEIILGGIRESLVKFPEISHVFCGVAGITVGNHASRMSELIRERYPSLSAATKSDSENLFGSNDDADLAVISGTGAVVFAKTEGRTVRIGGWGHIFDPLGSAYGIARDALEAVLAEEDFFLEKSTLGELMRERLATSRVFDKIGKLHNGGKPYVASLAPVVFEAYRLGDQKAISIIDRNMCRLAELLSHGAEHYSRTKLAVAGGGIFEHYADVVIPHINKYTDVQIRPCALPPIFGACRRSVQLSGKEVSQSFEENFKKTYGEKKNG